MLPNNRINPVGLRAEFLQPDDAPRIELKTDREFGGIALNNVSQGLRVQVWTLQYDNSTSQFQLSADSLTNTIVLFTVEDVEEGSFTFDQNMQPAVAYLKNGITYFRWFDTTVNAFVVNQYPNATSPMLSLDEKRFEFVSISDMILSYIRAQSVYYRIQRERFLIEHKAADLPVGPARIIGVGKSKNNRFQYHVRVLT